MRLLDKVFDFIFPEFCEICNQHLENQAILVCRSCLAKLPFLRLVCQRCGSLVSESLLEKGIEKLEYCSYCLEKNFYFDRVYALFQYKEPVSEWLVRIKFAKDFRLAYGLGKLLRSFFEFLLEGTDLVVPVPLSNERLKERGFNQSALLVWGFTKKKPLSGLLSRVKPTKPQTELSGRERWENVKGAFLAKDSVKEKRVLLVDDVMTTGATVNEAAKALKLKGAKEVYVLVVARNQLI
ncbi:ComF family protein [Thermodesulfobacterium sp. TA1]|uniref:ComF family protein n=1 Tax=Thermodesulfobacterium sp. TA1 TaxID=2234087 RepID=UPI0012328BAE|nr:ComF family protein [Thermodesulfobacterium sp. TA1]QER42503.1 ComF family protein [Thermodesulfobacterium sp. TA1]